MWEVLGIGGVKRRDGAGSGRWVSFWVWWGFKQASIYLGLGVALIDQTRSGPGPAPSSTAGKLFTSSPLFRRILPWLDFSRWEGRNLERASQP